MLECRDWRMVEAGSVDIWRMRLAETTPYLYSNPDGDALVPMSRSTRCQGILIAPRETETLEGLLEALVGTV